MKGFDQLDGNGIELTHYGRASFGVEEEQEREQESDQLISNKADVSLSPAESTDGYDDFRLKESKNVFQNSKLKFQLAASFISLFLIGLLDQAMGSIIEYIMFEYQITRIEISYLILAQFCGYIPASMTNSYVMKKTGVFTLYIISCLGIMWAGAAYILKLPYPFLVLTACCTGWCNGTLDCCLNFFVGTLEYSNQLLGVMHAMYGIGCLVAPVLSIHLINIGWEWNYFYFVIFSFAVVNLILVLLFFRSENGEKYRYEIKQEDEEEGNNNNISTIEIIKNKHVLFYSFALFVYVGGELSVGIWMFNYFFRIKRINESYSSYITSSFWFFMTLGRVLLGILTGAFFEDYEIKAIIYYCIIVSVGFAGFAVGAFIDKIWLQIVSILISGFFVGPLFATTIIISLKSLPKKYSFGGISIIAGFGGMGAAIIPSLMGFVSELLGEDGAGLKYFPVLTLFMFTLAALIWISHYLRYKDLFETKKRLD